MKLNVTGLMPRMRTIFRTDHNSRIETKIVSSAFAAGSVLSTLRRWLPSMACILAIGLSGCDVSDGSGIGGTQEPDPVVVDFAIAYVERPLARDEDDGTLISDDILDPAAFNGGARLILKDRATTSAPETVITAGIFLTPDGEEDLYDVKDLSVSGDGKKLLFAMRAPELENVDEEDQPTWNIWEYNLETALLRRVIPLNANIDAEAGQDVAPHYLPDGRIVFSSTRQRRNGEILIDERKSKYAGLDDKRDNEAFVLHVMEDDGSNIRQLTFNASHDLQPTVVDNGRILFLRWDAINRHNQLSLYTVNPDGSDLTLLYGYHSQNTGTNNTQAAFTKPRPLEDGRIMVALRQRESTTYGGDLIAIDTENFIDINQPIASNAGATGPAQSSLVATPVDTSENLVSRGGYYNSAYPLYDGTDRLLISWSQCRQVNDGFVPPRILPCSDLLVQQGALPADPLFGLWIYDISEGTQLPVLIPEEGTMYTSPVVMQSRPPATVISPEGLDPALVTDGLGVLHIRSVYDLDGTDSAPDGGIAAQADPARVAPDNREARFLRIVKNVPIPDENVLDFDNAIFGTSANLGMRDIIGYVPIEPDGSVKFQVPADIPFMVDVLDADGKRLHARHEVWLTLRPGEQRECTGCHSTNSELPHGRLDAEPASANPGAIGGMPFANTQLFDSFGTPQPSPEFGESMAEYYARINGPREPSADLIFTDEWTDPAAATTGTDVSLRYISFANTISNNPRDPRCAPRNNSPATWQPPTSCLTTGSWNGLCRTTINYTDSIHPLWEADRRECDEGGVVVRNVTCTDCHNRIDSLGNVRVPEGQLELTGEVSQDRNDYITSYAELMFQDNEQELQGMSLADRLINGDPVVDPNGDPVLDPMGNPTFEQLTVQLPTPLSNNGARASNRFFSRFEQGGSHYGRLSPDELKLIAEWLDIGGQYYNNPFDAPLN